MALEDMMITAIESMEKRDYPDPWNSTKKDPIRRAKHYGFVWGIMWMADKLGYKKVDERASQIMNVIGEELTEASHV